jgi:hypothetical protein
MINTKGRSFWTEETPGGGTKLRTRSKLLIAILLFLVAALVYMLLLGIEGLQSGADAIIILAYGAIVLMVVLILLVKG